MVEFCYVSGMPVSLFVPGMVRVSRDAAIALPVTKFPASPRSHAPRGVDDGGVGD